MPIYEIVFYAFSLVMLAGAVMVITVRNSVYAALSLVLTFFSASALWMLLEVEFLAIILILVYVGAVMVLFLFVVMMLDINLAPLKEGFIRYLPAGISCGPDGYRTSAGGLVQGRFEEGAYPIPAPGPGGLQQYQGSWRMAVHQLPAGL